MKKMKKMISMKHSLISRVSIMILSVAACDDPSVDASSLEAEAIEQHGEVPDEQENQDNSNERIKASGLNDLAGIPVPLDEDIAEQIRAVRAQIRQNSQDHGAHGAG